jgi:type VI secretion system protein ImpJ
MDDHYIPPVLSVDAWNQLGRGVVRGIHDLVIQEINSLVERLRDVNLRDHILEVTQSGRFALLDRLNESSCALGLALPANEIHPLVSYADFCRLIGRLAIFTREKRTPPLPRYDHDNLGPVFYELAAKIRSILESIRFKDFMQKNFVWEERVMQADLTPAWFDPRVEWYIGVERGEKISDKECRALLSRENQFLWKFGSKDKDIYSLGSMGLKLQAVERVAGLPPHQYWSYWQVPKDEMDAVFRAISKDHLVAAFMRDGRNRPYDRTQYAGTSRFPVFNHRDELIEFQLSLFGLPR